MGLHHCRRRRDNHRIIRRCTGSFRRNDIPSPFTQKRRKTNLKPIDATAIIPQGHGETVLLVEDEPAIRKLGTTMLQRLGYQVLAASAPSEGIRLTEENAEKVDLLITDVVMPEMNGRELADHLLARYPDIKILFMSGYTSNVIFHRGVLDDGVNFIPKPFSKSVLALKVQMALGRDTGEKNRL